MHIYPVITQYHHAPSRHTQRLKPGETLSLAALAERIRMNVPDIKPLLHSLACAKYKVCPVVRE